MPTRTFLLATLLFSVLAAQSQITLTVRRSFVDSFKNKITINANYAIYFAHKRPNPGSKDGDLHFAGNDARIGLPIVAEVMNAKDETQAVDLIHANEGHGVPHDKVKLTGVWRLWCEHPGDIQDFVQGRKNIQITNTNPPHVFEIHPVVQIDDIDLLNSLHPIDGFNYKDAEEAFSHYANLRCRITANKKTVKIETNGIGYNYVNFWLELNEANQQEVDDGLFAYCTIHTSDFNPTTDDNGSGVISHKLRVGFVKGSAVYNKVKSMNKGDFLHVVGIPRIDLALVAWRVDHSGEQPEVLQWNLPFEMVAVAELNE